MKNYVGGKIGEVTTVTKPYAALVLTALAFLLFFSVLRASIFQDVPEETRIWFELSFLLLAAVLAELLVVYLRQPTVMVLLLVGIAISPSAIELIYPPLSQAASFLLSSAGLNFRLPATIPHLIPTEGMVTIFAKLGAIILLFKIGMHSEIKQVFNTRNLLVALLGVIVPFLGGYGYAMWTGHGFNYAMFLGAALTATSVGVTVAVLQEFGMLERSFSKIILGAAVIDDILALLVLSLVKNMSEEATLALAPIMSIFITAGIFVIGGILLGQYIVKHYIDRSLVEAEGKISNVTFLSILAYLFVYAYVAEFIGLSAIVGAFIAGITLNYSRLTQKLFDLFYPLEAFFTPVFFISLGMLVNIPALAENILPILAITAIAIATKLVGCGLGAKFGGMNWKKSAVVGFGMVPRGEIALIIGLFGLTALDAAGNKILSPTEYSIIASMAFLTTVIVPAALQKLVLWADGNAKKNIVKQDASAA
ncbi:Glutathione-regulated potassium-efflux system protein KefB [Candidatus Burarchaeum australiense]|nr:Glutathione-regulated potassium-efflux system protein KefB [Candidatus Burarchaeum australiense]